MKLRWRVIKPGDNELVTAAVVPFGSYPEGYRMVLEYCDTQSVISSLDTGYVIFEDGPWKPVPVVIDGPLKPGGEDAA